MHVPQIRCQLGEFSFDIEPGAIPLDQCADSKSVSQIMQPRAATVILGRYPQAELLGYLGESVSSCTSGNPASTLGDEEGRSWCPGKEASSSFGVLFQCVYSRWVTCHMARLPKLRPPDVKDSTIVVDVQLVQAEGFVHSHPRCHQQTEEGRKREPAESLARRKLLGTAK